MEEESGDNSCYYPGCMKNAKCDCEICLASFNATRDLISNTPLTKLSVSKPKNFNTTPISFDSSFITTPPTPTQNDYPIKPSTPIIIKSSARSNSISRLKKKKRSPIWGFIAVLLFGLGFLLFADIVFSNLASGFFQPSLSSDLVKRVGEKSSNFQDLNGKLRFLQEELTSVVVDGKISNCSFTDSLWEITQDDLLLKSKCTMYKSAIEEVTIWGWPLQTAGMITTGFSFHTLIILSGRLTEWNGGQVGYSIRKANTSWVQPKWGASVVQLDPNTWVLEYQRSSIVDGTRLSSVALEFLKYRISRIIGKVKKYFWLLAAFEDGHYKSTTNHGLKIPT